MVFIIDSIWEQKVRKNLIKIEKLKKKLKETGSYSDDFKKSWSDEKIGPWEKKFKQTLKEYKYLEKIWEGSEFEGVKDEEILKQVGEEEIKKKKEIARGWIKEIVDSTNAEAGKTDEYDSTVNRVKGNNYHQRGHYFISYEDDSEEHWLTLYPPFDDNQLRDGHSHQAFVLNFDKPVQKFTDVYTCIGCGAAGQGFTDLHKDYDIDGGNSSDSWEVIHKGRPFEPWFTELTTAKFERKADGRIMSASGKYCLGNEQHINDFHVWEGKVIRDSADRAFDKAYGYISSGETIQWKLSRNSENEVRWVKKRIPYHLDKLWTKREFIAYKDELNPYKTKVMFIAIDQCFKDRKYVIDYLRERDKQGGNINNVLQEGIKERLWKLVSAKKNSYKFFEEWIKKILLSAKIEEELEKFKKSFNALQIDSDPEIIRDIWIIQIKKFIEEGKVREISSELDVKIKKCEEAKIGISIAYRQFLDNLKNSKFKFEDIKELNHVAQIIINP